jgi:hypothetical protein
MSNGWTPSSPCAPPTVYLPIPGGTMTGPLILAADPVQNLEAATKQYVDAEIIDQGGIGDNRIINGDMRIDQRNNGVGFATTGYTCDRWNFTATAASKFQWVRNSNAPVSLGFPYYLVAESLSAYTPLAGDTFLFNQPIEADQISDFAWGTSSAQPVTLSFWASSTLAGTFGGAVVNYTGSPGNSGTNRSYPFSYSLSAGVWTKIVVTVPGDTGGTWTLSGNGGGAYVRFDLGSGATFRAPAGAWANGNFVGPNGAVNVCATNAANFLVTGVKLEIGSVATPFNRQSLAKSMADCQRYYQVGAVAQNVGGNSWTAAWTNQHYGMFPVVMRAAPTTTVAPITQTNCSSTAITGQGNAYYLHSYQITAATGGVASVASWTASAEL